MSDPKFDDLFANPFNTASDPGDEKDPIEGVTLEAVILDETALVEEVFVDSKLEALLVKVNTLQDGRRVEDIGLSDDYHKAVEELQVYHANKKAVE